MPSKSEKQRRLMGAALAYKRGENKHPSKEVKKVADSMTEEQLEDMASKPLERQPTIVKSVEPYLNFNGNCEEAFKFYESVFDVKIVFISKYKDLPKDEMKNIPMTDMEKVLHVLLPISKNVSLMGSDSPSNMKTTMGNSVSLTLNISSREKAKTIFKKLSEGGKTIMPLEKTFWADLYAMFTDKFGIYWMINYVARK